MLTGSARQYYNVQTVSRERLLFEKIVKSGWWLRAKKCVDSHYKDIDGVKLSDHLIAVAHNVDEVFNRRHSRFITLLLELLEKLNLDKDQVKEELKIISLLHDIGKIEHDKSKQVPHPLHGYLTVKRHSIVSVYAAIEILQQDELLTGSEKARIFSVIEEHDVSFGLYREWMRTGVTPAYERWKLLNDRIDEKAGAGLMYLLFFKLADTHGHWNVSDVIWFFKQVKTKYFNRHGMDLPVPRERDVRLWTWQ